MACSIVKQSASEGLRYNHVWKKAAFLLKPHNRKEVLITKQNIPERKNVISMRELWLRDTKFEKMGGILQTV